MSASNAPKRMSVPLLMAAAALPIAAWMAHLAGSAAYANRLCSHPSAHWITDAFTAGTALICVGCGALGVIAWRRGSAPPRSEAIRFLGVLVVFIAVTNLLVIVWEGSYTEFLSGCR